MPIPSPSTLELGLAINRGHEQVCIEGIRKLQAASSHSFQRLEDINENLFLQRSVVFPSPVDKNVEVSQVPVAELESVAFEQAFLGPLLGIGKTDVNLANVSIRKGGEDLVLKLVSFFLQWHVILKCALDRPNLRASRAHGDYRSLSCTPACPCRERGRGEDRLLRKDAVHFRGGARAWSGNRPSHILTASENSSRERLVWKVIGS